MLLKFTLRDRSLIFDNPEIIPRETQVSFIQCKIDLKSRIFKASDTLIAVFKSASYNIEEEVLLDINYDIKDDEIINIHSFAYVPSRVFEHGGVIQLFIYKYRDRNQTNAQDATNTVEFYIDPNKYVPFRTSTIWQQLANEIAVIRSEGLQNVDYNDLLHRPSIEDVVLEGNKTFPQLNLKTLTNLEIENLLTNSGGV